MMSSESFASRLASGSPGLPAKAVWWPGHVRVSADYVLWTSKPRCSRPARDAALAHAEIWDRWAPTAGGMRQHVALETGLVDAARAGLVGKVEAAGELLARDAGERAAELAVRIESFPEDRFRRLLEEHAALFVERVRLAVEGRDARTCARHAEANALALAAFTVEWL